MHDFVALDPLSISVGVAKLTEADGAGNLSRLAKQPRVAAWPLQVGGDNAVCGKGAGGFSLHPCRGSVGSALKDPWGSRPCRRPHFKGFGFTRHRASSVSLAWLSGDRWAHVGKCRSAPCALRPLIT